MVLLEKKLPTQKLKQGGKATLVFRLVKQELDAKEYRRQEVEKGVEPTVVDEMIKKVKGGTLVSVQGFIAAEVEDGGAVHHFVDKKVRLIKTEATQEEMEKVAEASIEAIGVGEVVEQLQKITDSLKGGVALKNAPVGKVSKD